MMTRRTGARVPRLLILAILALMIALPTANAASPVGGLRSTGPTHPAASRTKADAKADAKVGAVDAKADASQAGVPYRTFW